MKISNVNIHTNKSSFLSIILTLLLVISCYINAQTKYYLSSKEGDDSRTNIQAQNSSTPWKTLDKLNSFFVNILPGDSILFKCGDTFNGSLVVNKSGTSIKSIVLSSYGSGQKPIISGFSTLSGWASLGNNIYETTVSNNGNNIKCVEINGKVQPIGRYPKFTAENEGYSIFESHSTNQIVDNQLTNTPNWSGGEIVVRKNNWVISKYSITSHLENTISFMDDGIYPLVDLSGYFIQNHPSTLSIDGDWCYDKSSQKFRMYYSSSPSNLNIKSSTIDKLITINANNYIKISNISFEGANSNAIYAENVISLSVENCDFNLSGVCNVKFNNMSGDIQFNNNTVSNSLNNGVSISTKSTSFSSYCTIRNNLITNTGLYAGMGENNDGMYNALYINAMNGGVVEYNTIKNVGYLGIEFKGNDILIKNNVVDNFCLNKDDGAGIYTWNGGLPVKIWKNRTVQGNIISNGIGNVHGAAGATVPKARGIYMDNIVNNVNIVDNTVYNIVGNFGSHNNSPSNITMTGNTFYNIGACLDLIRWPNDGSEPINGGNDITNMNIQNNIFFSTSISQKGCEFADRGLNYPTPSIISQSFSKVGIVNNNYYHLPNELGFSYMYRNDKNSPFIISRPLSFDAWKSVSGYEHTGKLIKSMPSYIIDSIASGNLYPQGEFESNTYISSYSSPFYHTIGWDNTGKITGPGSMKLTINSPPASNNNYVLMYAPIGPVSSKKNYILRFTTLGTTENGIVGATFRQTNSPWGSLLQVQKRSFGILKKNHEFLLKAPKVEASASWEISIIQDAGVTYIDNIEVYEANISNIDINDCARFEVNATNTVKSVPLDSEYMTMEGILYTKNLTLQPYTSKILIAKQYYDLSITNSITKNINVLFNCYQANDYIIIHSDNITDGKTYKILITDLLGRILYSKDKQAVSSKIQLNDFNLKTGIYIVELVSDRYVFTKKIVLREFQ